MKTTWTIFLLFCIQSCATQNQVVDHSFTFLDKWGLTTGYEIQYVAATKKPLVDAQKEMLFIETRIIASIYGREIALIDFITFSEINACG